jgi:hypothetical protein
MGLDMYAYTATRAGQQNEFYETGEYVGNEFVNTKVTKPVRLAYWRKHPNLHGWMQQLWESQGNEGDFNGDELELTAEDLDALELAVTHEQLPATGGFFFGNPCDKHYREQDLAFVKAARQELFLGLKVFYNSSW